MLGTGSHCEITEEFQAFLRHLIFQDEARAYISDLIFKHLTQIIQGLSRPCCSDCCTKFLKYSTLDRWLIPALAPHPPVLLASISA